MLNDFSNSNIISEEPSLTSKVKISRAKELGDVFFQVSKFIDLIKIIIKTRNLIMSLKNEFTRVLILTCSIKFIVYYCIFIQFELLYLLLF